MTNPVPQTDSIFLRRFGVLIAFLAFLAFLLFLLADHIYSDNPPPVNPNATKAASARTEPVGAVYAGDTGRAAMQTAQADAAKAAASQVAYGGTLDGKTIYGSLCHSCHDAGIAGAPKISDKSAWAPRVAEGKDTLVKHAIEGYSGKNGVMPPKGGNPALSDAQVKATVEFILSQVK